MSAEHRKALVQERFGAGRFTLEIEDVAEFNKRLSPCVGSPIFDTSERMLKPAATLGEVSERLPEPAERRRKTQEALAVPCSIEPIERGAEVRMFSLQLPKVTFSSWHERCCSAAFCQPQ